MENQIYLVNQLIDLTEEELRNYSQDWLVLARLLIQPTFFQLADGPTELFELELVQALLADSQSINQQWLTVGDEENALMIYFSEDKLLEKIILNEKIYQHQQNLLTDYQIQRLQKKGLYGYVRSYQEYLMNNTPEISKRGLFESTEETAKLPKMKALTGEVIVDCNHLAGYDIFYKELCLTSCWKMYFTKAYYSLFLKEIFLDVQQVDSVKELENQLIEVVLFANPFNWQHPTNRQFQELFRSQMGFNQIVWNNGVGILQEPFIEFAKRDHCLQTVQYQNSRLQPVPKSNATHFVTRSYDLIKEAYGERRVFGALNAQAYFPWVDEKGTGMMNYKVLNPQLTLDEGLAAYEYYIRSHLEIKVKDEQYQKYTPILQLFIPEEQFDSLPLTPLKERLADVTIGRTQKMREGIRLDLKKGENHLQVLFLSQ
ncbi:hypothetical protein M2139_000165 [Enterococcus sp. PF1-24]|uniref:hypothetical protein n=1 Tax=unclassified Enterococcus TaxID=2608891 RepID=UPI0024750F6F|nr:MULTISPECIES: hypothetical protein [unclassified Enterococcus]MDH6363190.1 hypothetical protein [Enterococcus sp. PFB1-1]MDH6400284.1 hypothetical protein [Enterococcus sp. PF1-24]